MMNVGVGEIMLTIVVVFMIAPREVPRVLRWIGRAMGTRERVRRELATLEREVREISLEGERRESVGEGDPVASRHVVRERNDAS